MTTVNQEQTIAITNPATGEIITEVEDVGAEGVDKAVVKARSSFEQGVWKDLTASERAKILWRIADLTEQRLEELL